MKIESAMASSNIFDEFRHLININTNFVGLLAQLGQLICLEVQECKVS